MKLNDNVYNVLKWLALIAIPAVGVLYNALAAVWGWGCTTEISGTCNALTVFIGAMIGISTAEYNKNKTE